jgi:hypothetical protein
MEGVFMKKLKCSSCGGNLVVDSSNEYATCEYCDTKYKLNEDLNVNIKMDDSAKEVYGNSKAANIISVFVIFIIGAIVCVIVASMGHSGFSSYDNSYDYDRSSFNLSFSNVNGTQIYIFVGHTLDDVISSNKTNSRKISVVYDGRETTDEKEIIDIKHSLSGFYEVSIDYDSDGYVNRIGLEKAN